MSLSPEFALFADLLVLLTLVIGALFVLRLAFPAFQTRANRLFDRINEKPDGWLRPLRSPLEGFKNDWVFVVAMGLVLLVAAFAFLYMAEDVIEGDPAQMADRATYWYMRSLRNPVGDVSVRS